jgi:DNA (cytosine-5)-methyltransferase 1
VQGAAKGYFIEILQALKDSGYVVKACVLNASYLGVPQARRRLIFVGVRNDVFKATGVEPVHPRPRKSYLTVREVLPHISYIKSQENGILTYVPSDVPSPTITASDGVTGETASFSCGGFCETRKGERRKYKISELKKLFSIPDDFKLTGTFEQQWERLGRSVPVLMMYAVSSGLADSVLKPYYAGGGK